MKKLLFIPLLVFTTYFAQAQGMWLHRALYPSEVAVAKLSFTIDSVGYVFTADTGANFFAYNSNTNTWAAKASFPGTMATGMAGFSIGHYGYIGAGELTDFWQYDAVNNSWSRKASMPDTVFAPFAFSINDTGYIYAGLDPNGTILNPNYNKAVYAYHPETDTWTRKSNGPEDDKYGFAINSNGKAYCGFGLSPNGWESTFWEYNAATDSWRQLANFPGPHTYPTGALGFTVDSQIYVPSSSKALVYIYDIPSNTWKTGPSFPSLGTCAQSGLEYAAFTIDGKGYFAGSGICDSTYFWEFDPSLYFKITSLSKDSICMTKPITVGIATNYYFSDSNQFRIGLTVTNRTPGVYALSAPVIGHSSGTYTFTLPAGVYNNGTPDQIAVFSSSPFEQTPYDTLLVEYVDVINMPPYTICLGDTQLLMGVHDNSKYYWSTDAGVFDTTDWEVRVAPITTTTYYVSVSVYANFCPRLDTTTVTVLTLTGNIVDTNYLVCPNTSITLGSTPLANCSYSWTDSAGFTSTQFSPTVINTVSDTYYLIIKDTLSPCSANAKVVVNIKQPPPQGLCLVTVDTTIDRNLIVWEKADKWATDSFKIYREITTNNYSVIATIPRDSLSEFEDSSADPGTSSFRYKITAIDTCGHESILSRYHNTIHLVYIGSGQLQWNDYEIEDTITPVSSYDVYIDSLNNDNFQLLGSVPGTQNAFTDVNYSQNLNARYLVHANFNNGCTPSRNINSVLSNFAYKSPVGISELNGNSVQIYPNPVMNQFTVQSDLLGKETVFTVYDVTGKQLNIPFVKRGDKVVFTSADLADGIYFISISCKQSQVVKKFAKTN